MASSFRSKKPWLPRSIVARGFIFVGVIFLASLVIAKIFSRTHQPQEAASSPQREEERTKLELAQQEVQQIQQQMRSAVNLEEKAALQKKLDELDVEVELRTKYQQYEAKVQRAHQIDLKMQTTTRADERAALQKEMDELKPYIDLEARYRKKLQELEAEQPKRTQGQGSSPLLILDTDSSDLIKVVDFNPPSFTERPIDSRDEEFLTWFSPTWVGQRKKVSDEVSSIQDAQMKDTLFSTKMNALRSSDLTICIQEAHANWVAYEKKVLAEHMNNLMEVEAYSYYSPQDEMLNSKYKLPLKDMDTIYFKVKDKHLDLIKSRVQVRTQGRTIELAVYNQEFAPGGQQQFQKSIWPEVEEGVRKDVLVLAYSQTTKELLLIDRQDHEIYYKWEHVVLNREDTLLGREIAEKRKR